MKQSYPFTAEDAWITIGDQVFLWTKLDEHRIAQRQQPAPLIGEIDESAKFKPDPTGKLMVWDLAKKGVHYDIGVDVAMGSSIDDDADDTNDWSVICVLERGSNKQVAEWRSKSVDVLDLARVVINIGNHYNRAQVAVETNSIGIATNMHMSKLGYPNMYVWRYRDEVAARFSKKIGWDTSYRTKKLLVSFAVNQLNNDQVKINSPILLDEMRHYVRVGDEKYGGAHGHHDDHVMAWLIALTTSDDENFAKWMGYTEGKITQAVQDDPRVVVPDIGPWNTDPWAMKKPRRKDYDAWDY